MTANIYKYLHFTNYRDITNWSVQYAVENGLGFTKKYPMARIGSFITRRKDSLDILDSTMYKRVTISTKGGSITIRDEKNGKDIGTKKQFVIHVGQFLLSKIDARNGAFGVVPPIAEGAIITGNFWTYDVDYKKINPLFLTLVTKTKQFLDFAERCSNGTTNRHYLQENAFLQQLIPLPNMNEQIKIVDEYYENIRKASCLEERAKECDAKINKYIMSLIDFEEDIESSNDCYNSFSLYHLAKLSRWDCYNFHYSFNTSEKVRTLAQLIKSKPLYGAPYSAIKYDNRVRYIRITDIKEDGSLSENKVSANHYNETFLLKENDFLIARSGNTVGKTFLYSSKYGPAIFAGYLIKFEIDEKIILPQYLLAYSKTILFKNWIKSNMRISAQPNINSKQYLSAPIVVPDMAVQRKIVDYAQNINEHKMRLIEDAHKVSNNIKNSFVKLIYNMHEA